MNPTKWWRPIECLILIGHFLQKSPIIGGCFAERDLQVEASCAFSPPCNVQVHVQSWRSRIDVCDVMRNTFVSSVVLHLKNAAHTHTNVTSHTHKMCVAHVTHTHTHKSILPHICSMQHVTRMNDPYSMMYMYIAKNATHTHTGHVTHTHKSVLPHICSMHHVTRMNDPHSYMWLYIADPWHYAWVMPYTHTNVCRTRIQMCPSFS